MRLISVLRPASCVLLALAFCFTSPIADIVDRKREPVVVIIDADKIPLWVGKSMNTSSFELWAYDGSSWDLVPYQIDELRVASDKTENDAAEPLPVEQFINDAAYSSRRICNGPNEEIPAGMPPCEYLYDLRGENDPDGFLSETDELVFIAGSAGSCNAPLNSWPTTADHADYRQKIVLEDNPSSGTEKGCVYLYRRIQGTRPSIPDLIDYDPVGDGVPSNCIPHADACGAIIGSAYDIDGDGFDDFPSYRMDYVGNWSMDRFEIGSTQGNSSADLMDINKSRIENPAETERAWDQVEPDPNGLLFGCAVFPGFIDGPVRVIRPIQGAVSGVGTRRVEFMYPGERVSRTYLRVHEVDGPIYQYYDLLKSNVSPTTEDRAIIYNKDNNGAEYFDKVDGVPASKTLPEKPRGWFQMSSSKGSYLVFHGEERDGTLDKNSSGETDYQTAYSDQMTAAWNASFPVEYDEETGERGAYRSNLPSVTNPPDGSQNLTHCEDPYNEAFNPRTIITEKKTVMLSGVKAMGDAGALEMAKRNRGVLSQCIVQEQKDGGSGGGTPCVPTLNISYSNDGGIVDLNINGCSQSKGWNLYHEKGGGVRERIGTMGPNETYHDGTLELNEQKSYSATSLDETCDEGGHSSTSSVNHIDTTPPTEPTNVTADVAMLQITVEWTVPTTPDIAGYRVKVADTSGGPYTQTHSGLVSNMVNSYTFAVVQSGTYYVIVSARDHAGNEGPASAELTVVVP